MIKRLSDKDVSIILLGKDSFFQQMVNVLNWRLKNG